jgi:hypothetical protein
MKPGRTLRSSTMKATGWVASDRGRAHSPALPCLVVVRRHDAGVQLDVAAEIVTVGDAIEIRADLRLGGKAFGPGPLLLKLRPERIRVHDGLDVAPRARVAVLVLRSADADADADAEHVATQPELAAFIQHIKTGNAGFRRSRRPPSRRHQR